MDYAEAGVNIELGDEASKILYTAAKQTFANRQGKIGEVIVPFDDFSGLRAINVSNLPEGSFMCLSFDGIGTKVEIAQRMNNHTTIAHDLFATVCDDAIVRGGEPVIIGSVLDVHSLSDIEAVKQLAQGYVEAAQLANVAVINGELAELGDTIGGLGRFKYNWCSGLVWFANKNKLFTGKEINVGDDIVMFEEKGFRSNGFSLVRKSFAKLGDDWHNQEFEGDKLGNHVLTPSTIYSKAIVGIHGGFQTPGTCTIHGVAHITGGGIPSKVGRILLASGFGAKLDNVFAPSKAIQYCQKVGDITDKEAYRTWSMGNGLAVVTPEADKVIAEAKKYGINAQVAGQVTEQKGIILESKGIHQEKLVF